MNELNNMLFALLRSVLCGETLDMSLVRKLDEEKLENLYKISKRHDMAHLVGAALDAAGLLNHGKTSRKFAKQKYIAVFRYEKIRYEQERICKVFDEAGIDYIPLKGMVIRDLYPEPWMRTSCDIDVLVRDREVDSAVQALVNSLGYACDPRNNIHDVLLYSESGVHIELHYSVIENIPSIDCVLQGVWDYAFPISEGKREHRLSKEFFIFHLIAHASYHFINGGCGIRPIFDLWLMTHDGAYDRDKVLSLCSEGNLERFFCVLEELAKVWFENHEHNKLTRSIEKYILNGGVYGAQESKIAVVRDSKGGKAGYIFSRIFVSYGHLKFKYPSLKSRALVPIYQVRRWFSVLKEKKFSNYLNEYRINQNLNNDKVDEIGALMDELELENLIKRKQR